MFQRFKLELLGRRTLIKTRHLRKVVVAEVEIPCQRLWFVLFFWFEINLHTAVPLLVRLSCSWPSPGMSVQQGPDLRTLQTQLRLPLAGVVGQLLRLVQDQVRVVVDAGLAVHQAVGPHHQVPHQTERTGPRPATAHNVLTQLSYKSPELTVLERHPGPPCLSPVNVALLLLTEVLGLQVLGGLEEPLV